MDLECEMSYCNELVAMVREAAGLKLDAVAAATHFSTSAINRYEHGSAPVPAEYLARLWRLTRDLRCMQFMDESIDLLPVRQMVVRTPPPGDPRTLLPELLKDIKRFGQVCELVERIVSDGRVDEEDDNMLARMLDEDNKLIASLVKAHQSLAWWREQAERRPIA